MKPSSTIYESEEEHKSDASMADVDRPVDANSMALREHVDNDTAVSRDVAHASDSASAAEIVGLQTHAKAIHTNVKWLKSLFGLLTSSDARVRGQVCSICRIWSFNRHDCVRSVQHAEVQRARKTQ
jgi:hypothetical protein